MQTGFFQKIKLFSQASPTSLQQISHAAKKRLYKKGTIILDRYQSQQTFLYVINGWIKLFRESSDGEEVIVDMLTQNHHCGATFLFESKEEDTYMAKSISEIEIFTLPTTLLKRLVASDHNLSLCLMHSILQKQKSLSVHIEHLSIQNAMQRIGCFLLRLRSDIQFQKNIKLRLPYDKVLLASRLGMRPETFSRALSKLSRKCDLHVDNELIAISCPLKLIQYVCQHCSQIFPCNLEG
ncbi:MAG: hypothetical protein K0R48_408 [Gammaproteobacteria bacterium]|jgi:CRP-like cAMP-binding protein|nr:hypothetical protein [Gammaproteobacteria bacterium]